MRCAASRPSWCCCTTACCPATCWPGRSADGWPLPVLAALQHGLHGRLPVAAIWGTGVLTSLAAAWVFYRTVERPAHRLAQRVERMA